MWRDDNDNDIVLFNCVVSETGKECISGGWARIVNSNNNAVNKGVNNAAGGLKTDAVFEEMRSRIAQEPELAAKAAATLQWNVTQNGKDVVSWVADLKKKPATVTRYEPGKVDLKADVIIIVSDDDMDDLVKGKLNPQKAFMSGKIKAKGNIMLLQKLQGLMGQHKAKI